VPTLPSGAYDRKVGFNTRIVEWVGLTAGFTWYYETETKNTYPKIQALDFATIYTSNWMNYNKNSNVLHYSELFPSSPCEDLCSYLLNWTLGNLLKLKILGLCRLFILLGSQSEKDVYLAQLWSLLTIEPQ
jgi:hypothetical protein